MSEDNEFNVERYWTRFILKLKQAHPFFSSLAFHAEFVISEETEIAETQGSTVVINATFFNSLTQAQQYSYLLHQILHLALQHQRRGYAKNAQIWNVAADIVVNDIIMQSTDWVPAPLTAWDKRYRDCSVEIVYRDLLRQSQKEVQTGDSGDAESDANAVTNTMASAGASAEAGATESANNTPEVSTAIDKGQSAIDRYESHADMPNSSNADGNSKAGMPINDAQTYWKQAMLLAKQMSISGQLAGKLPGGLELEFDAVATEKVSWKQILWRYLSQSRDDYAEFDSRHIHRGLYLEYLHSERLRIAIAIDTSGSVSRQELSVFMRELMAIGMTHPNLTVDLYYADADLHGPYKLVDTDDEPSVPIGGGGTSFSPFFDKVREEWVHPYDLAIYFTDGFADYPTESPRVPVLWVLTETGEEETRIPFGTTLRLTTEQTEQ